MIAACPAHLILHHLVKLINFVMITNYIAQRRAKPKARICDHTGKTEIHT